jgi:hypothetical protein
VPPALARPGVPLYYYHAPYYGAPYARPVYPAAPAPYGRPFVAPPAYAHPPYGRGGGPAPYPYHR